MSEKFAIDTNILVYAHNIDSPFHHQAKAFMIDMLKNHTDELVIPYQTFIEFISTMTRRIEKPLPIEDVLTLVKYYLNKQITIIYPKNSQFDTFFDLFAQTPYRGRFFDVLMIATLKDNGVNKIFTVNVKDFQGHNFLTVENPFQ